MIFVNAHTHTHTHTYRPTDTTLTKTFTSKYIFFGFSHFVASFNTCIYDL